MKKYLVGFIIIVLGLSVVFFSIIEKQKAEVSELETSLQLYKQNHNLNMKKLQVLSDFAEGKWTEAIELSKEYDLINPDKDNSLFSFLSKQFEKLTEIDSLGNSELARAQLRLQKTRDSLNSSLTIVEQREQSITNLQLELSNSLENKSELIASLSDCRDQLKLIRKSDTLNFKVSTGYFIRYFGEVSNGMANGIGSGFWPSGGYYHGQWRDNSRNGKGKYTWKEGHVYIGNFANDLRTGEGIYIWSHGERYEGNWKNNLRHGFGVLYHPDGKIKFSGNWENDRPIQ